MTTLTIDEVLTDLARSGATGSLRVGGSGTVYVTGGRVSYVECTSTPSVEELLTSSGRISETVVRNARQTSDGAADGGDLLVSKGVLTLGELQFCVLGTTLDASFFLLDAEGARFRFMDGDRHWLGTHWSFEVGGLFHECRRRRARLDQAWPSPALDTRPVIPAQRVPDRQVVLTDLQSELLRNADHTATPMELAKRLGRPAYATLLAVRELASAGLLTPPRLPDPKVPPSPPFSSPSGTREALPKRGERSGPRPRLTQEPPTPLLPEGCGDPHDIDLLIRLRDALEAL